jgi:hypothetical protein
MRDKGDHHYEYVAVYVDDLLIASRESIITALETTHKFKLKGSDPRIPGCDFVRDEHGRLGYAPIKYIEKRW